MLGVNPSKYLKLCSREIIFELFQLILHLALERYYRTDGQTDGQVDGRHTVATNTNTSTYEILVSEK